MSKSIHTDTGQQIRSYCEVEISNHETWAHSPWKRVRMNGITWQFGIKLCVLVLGLIFFRRKFIRCNQVQRDFSMHWSVLYADFLFLFFFVDEVARHLYNLMRTNCNHSLKIKKHKFKIVFLLPWTFSIRTLYSFCVYLWNRENLTRRKIPKNKIFEIKENSILKGKEINKYWNTVMELKIKVFDSKMANRFSTSYTFLWLVLILQDDYLIQFLFSFDKNTILSDFWVKFAQFELNEFFFWHSLTNILYERKRARIIAFFTHIKHSFFAIFL